MMQAIFLGVLLFFTGCGYTFQGSGSVLPEDVKNVYVPLAVNDTTEPGLARLVTEAMQERFERFGVVQVVDSLNQADAVLNTRIVSLSRNKRTVTSGTDTALQLDSVLTLAVNLRRTSGPLLWENKMIQARRTFGTSSNVVVTSSPGFASGGLNQGDLDALDSREIARGQEGQVLELLATQAARQVYTQAVEPDF